MVDNTRYMATKDLEEKSMLLTVGFELKYHECAGGVETSTKCRTHHRAIAAAKSLKRGTVSLTPTF